MLAWSWWTDNGRQKTRKSWLWRHCRRRAAYWYLDHLRKLVTLNPKLKSRRRRTLPFRFFPVGGMPTASSLPGKTSLRKVRTLWHCSRLRSKRLPGIDRGDIRQAIDRCSNIWLHCRCWLWWFIKALTAWLQNSKKRAEIVKEIDVWAESPRLSPPYTVSLRPKWPVGWIITVITPRLTKPSATKMPENWSWRTRHCRQADASAWCCCARCKWTKELADAKAENDALRDDAAAGRRRLHIKAVCQSVREATTALRVW